MSSIQEYWRHGVDYIIGANGREWGGGSACFGRGLLRYILAGDATVGGRGGGECRGHQAEANDGSGTGQVRALRVFSFASFLGR